MLNNLNGMETMNDQVIATDMFIATKASIIMYANALTKTTSSDVVATLRFQLNEAISSYKVINNYMKDRNLIDTYSSLNHNIMDVDIENSFNIFE